MMGLYIRGKGMPSSCFTCVFLKHQEDGDVCNAEQKKIELQRGHKKPSWCPLVEIKEKEAQL